MHQGHQVGGLIQIGHGAIIELLVIALAKFRSADAERERGLVQRLLGVPSLIESTLALDDTIR
ncbi:MAG: hypothetical protein ACO3TU_09195, partial [Burkholderiaceae bacterium]